MAILKVPDHHIVLDSEGEIRAFLADRGILYDRWEAGKKFGLNASEEEILQAYSHVLKPYMEQNGYTTADVINISPETPSYPVLREKFLHEHTHTEDEVRFFVEGEGLFWFNIPENPVFNVLCQSGDLISVPANTPHWFDAGESLPFVKAIRIFTDKEGWTPHYTHSGIEEKYL